MSHSFDLVVLLTSIPSETSINIAFIVYKKTYFFGNTKEAFSKKILYQQLFLSLLKTDLINIITL